MTLQNDDDRDGERGIAIGDSGGSFDEVPQYPGTKGMVPTFVSTDQRIYKPFNTLDHNE